MESITFTRETLEADLQGSTSGEAWERYCQELIKAHDNYVHDHFRGEAN